MKIKKILSSSIWFLISCFLFAFAGARFLIIEDTTGAIIYLVAAFLFLIGFIGQAVFNRKKPGKKTAEKKQGS